MKWRQWLDKRIWAVANGKDIPAEYDYSETRKLYDVPTNFKTPITILPPEAAKKTFTIAEGYEVNLFASEVEFPELKNPVQFTFDTQGRLWVATMPSYPQYLPPHKPSDKLLVFTDEDGDGKADKMETFADDLHLPTGFELGDGGVYVAQEPNLVFLKDTNGDGKADLKKILLWIRFRRLTSCHRARLPGALWGNLYARRYVSCHASRDSRGTVRNPAWWGVPI